MTYRYFAQQHTEFDHTNKDWTRKPIAIYRVNEQEFGAERYTESGNWQPDESGYVIEAFLGIDGVTEYDEITESEAENLKKELFPETG